MARRKRGPFVMRPGGPVVAAMVMVVLCFAAGLVYLQVHLQPVTHRALTVIDHAAPSIEHLSGAQTDLTRYGIYLGDYVLRDSQSRTSTRIDIRAARRALGAGVESFRALREIPGEGDLLARVDADLELLDGSADLAMDEADAARSAAARQLFHAAVQPQLIQTSADLAQLKTLNARFARDAADDILRTRRQAVVVTAGLGTVAVLVAIVATMLVLRLLGMRARLINQHTETLAARASELEAFAGRVAHDLRNPLSAIALRVLSASRREGLEPRAREDLNKVAGQIDRMNRIISGLLEFARAGANPPPGAAADISEVVDEVVSDAADNAAGMGAQLRVEPFPATRVACTPGALTSVLSNLVGNAVKYIGEGNNRPRRIVVRVAAGAERVRVQVEDNGPGLPPGAEQRVFEPFRRLTQSTQPGIGLGLATVKKIVDAYGGRVGVDSTLGQGSTFWFELPRAAAEARPRSALGESQPLRAL